MSQLVSLTHQFEYTHESRERCEAQEIAQKPKDVTPAVKKMKTEGVTNFETVCV